MKHIVKFRGRCHGNGWREDGLFKDGDWAIGLYHQLGYGPTTIDYAVKQNNGLCKTYRPSVESETVSQFIGLYDKNDNEIYEGDIISVCGKYNRVVEWCGLGWGIIPVENFYDEDGWREMMVQQPDIKWWNDHKDQIEIIGNIYDNPQLLKV